MQEKVHIKVLDTGKIYDKLSNFLSQLISNLSEGNLITLTQAGDKLQIGVNSSDLLAWLNANYPDNDTATAITSPNSTIIVGGSGFNRTVDVDNNKIVDLIEANLPADNDTPTDISSPDGSIDVGGSGFSRTVAINNSALLDKVFNMLQQGGSVEISKQDDLIVVSTPTLSFYSPDGSITGGFDANGLLQLTASQSTGVGTYDVVHKTSHIVENQAIPVMPNDPSFDPNNPFATITDADYLTIEGLDYGLTHAVTDPNDDTKVLVNCCDIDIVVHFDKPVDADNFQFFDVKLTSNNTDIHIHEILSFASSELGIIGAVGQAKAFYIKARIIGSNKQTVDDNAVIYVKIAAMDVAGVTTTLNVIAPTHWLAHEWYAKQLPPDTTPLLVEWTEPENLSENVPLDQAITIDWNADIELVNPETSSDSFSNLSAILENLSDPTGHGQIDIARSFRQDGTRGYSIVDDKLILQTTNMGVNGLNILQGSSDYKLYMAANQLQRSNGQTNEYFEMFFKTEQEPSVSFDVTVANDGDIFQFPGANFTADASIDWGDGSTSTPPADFAKHTYATAGVYRFKMYGHCSDMTIFHTIASTGKMMTGEMVLNASASISMDFSIRKDLNITKLTGKYKYPMSSTAFRYSEKLVEVYLPNVIELQRGAFDECYSLKSANLPAVKYIGSEAFTLCPLEILNIQAVTEIEGTPNYKPDTSPFHATGLTSLALPNLQYVGDRAFYGMSRLIYIYFGSAITSFGSAVFSGTPTTAIALELCTAEYALADLTNLTWRGYTWKSITERNS